MTDICSHKSTGNDRESLRGHVSRCVAVAELQGNKLRTGPLEKTVALTVQEFACHIHGTMPYVCRGGSAPPIVDVREPWRNRCPSVVGHGIVKTSCRCTGGEKKARAFVSMKNIAGRQSTEEKRCRQGTMNCASLCCSLSLRTSSWRCVRQTIRPRERERQRSCIHSARTRWVQFVAVPQPIPASDRPRFCSHSCSARCKGHKAILHS